MVLVVVMVATISNTKDQPVVTQTILPKLYLLIFSILQIYNNTTCSVLIQVVFCFDTSVTIFLCFEDGRSW